MKHICENCGNEHDGSYGSGRFCSNHCKQSYISKKKLRHPSREELQSRKGFGQKRSEYGTWKCDCCG